MNPVQERTEIAKPGPVVEAKDLAYALKGFFHPKFKAKTIDWDKIEIWNSTPGPVGTIDKRVVCLKRQDGGWMIYNDNPLGAAICPHRLSTSDGIIYWLQQSIPQLKRTVLNEKEILEYEVISMQVKYDHLEEDDERLYLYRHVFMDVIRRILLKQNSPVYANLEDAIKTEFKERGLDSGNPDYMEGAIHAIELRLKDYE